MNSAGEIKSKALQLGFDLVGITDASPISRQQIELLSDWLTRGYAGRMDFMHRNFKMRIDPRQHLPDAQSVICVALNYRPVKPWPPPASSENFFGVVADYALYEDYHRFMKKKLRELALFISALASTGFKFKICVDSSPLAERALAARAGLGIIGKNCMLINPALGPQLFLAEIITNLQLQPGKPTPTSGDCSNCNSCIAACPMGALQGDGLFDAGRCINYLTIEYKGQIPSEFACKFANHLVGCDECVHVCPYYQKAPPCRNGSFKFYPDRAYLDLHQLLNMSKADFDAKLAADSPLKHVGLERLKRNARICLSNITG
jgi:epoxyqueuosine reductase